MPLLADLVLECDVARVLFCCQRQQVAIVEESVEASIAGIC